MTYRIIIKKNNGLYKRDVKSAKRAFEAKDEIIASGNQVLKIYAVEINQLVWEQ